MASPPTSGSADQVLLSRLHEAQETSWRQGHRTFVESYLQRHPSLGADLQSVLLLVTNEVALRQQAGEAPDLAEYLSRFPQLASQLQVTFSEHGGAPPAAGLDTVASAPQDSTEAVRKAEARRVGADTDPPRRGDASAPPPAQSGTATASHDPEAAPIQGVVAAPADGGTRSLADPAQPGEFGTRSVVGDTPPSQAELQGWPTFEGYELLQELGRGGMGIVYRARDRKRQRLVALKTLQGMSARALYRFKQEFRGLAGVTHPNLVPLYELMSDGAQWCFTMELVVGVDLLTYIRFGPRASRQPRLEHQGPPLSTPDQFGRLRAALAQLAEGIHALHQADRLHRDIKPSNALVTPQGKTLLLDFGLVAEIGDDGIYQSTEQHVLGTAAYMSPEQAAAQAVGPPTDWYSVGVIMYEALTGQLPFQGGATQVLRDKIANDAPLPRTLAPAIPEDLEHLCQGLLCRAPQARPTGPEVLRALTSSAPEDHVPEPAPRGAVELLGREKHLRVLHDAYRSVQHGGTVIVDLAGRSGMGKSTLLNCFLDAVRDQPDVVVLAGQCYEKESVPYKAFDSLIDALSQYVERIPSAELQALLPRDVVPLTRVFPVLNRLAKGLDASRQRPVADAHELRRRAFAAFRELLARLGDRRPLVLAIDDLQWADLDSLALYQDLLRPPDPPRLLFIGAYRSEETQTSRFLQGLLASKELDQVEKRSLAVEPLTEEESRQLALQLLDQENSADQTIAATIAREAGGNPFFVAELVQHARSAAAAGTQPAAHALSLAGVIANRVQRLPDDQRRLLEVLAVAGCPLQQLEAAEAAGLAVDERAAVASLLAARLVRSTGNAVHEELVTYHDRVRETVASQLSGDRLGACHGRLAKVLEGSGRAPPEALAFHFHGAGDRHKATAYYTTAADKAAAALAFDQAARFYQAALDLRPADPVSRQTLRVKRADTLANAGRGSRAAKAYLEAADHSPEHDVDLRRRAATQLLRTGHVDQGIAVLGNVLKIIGMEWPSTPGRALRLLLWRRFRLWWRGLKFQERSESDLPHETLLRLDICYYVGACLTFIDWIRGAELEARGLLLALDAGEPRRIARSLLMEAGHAAVTGGARAAARAEHIIQTAEVLTKQINTPYMLALLEAARGAHATNLGQWKRVSECSTKAGEIFRQCTGATWELDTVLAYSLSSLAHMGQIAELSQRCLAVVQEASERDDQYLVALLGTYSMTVVRLAADHPDEAAQELERIHRAWSREGFHVQHHAAFLGHTLVALYRQDGPAALQIVSQHLPVYRRSLLWYIQHLRVDVLQYYARGALAAAAAVAAPERGPLLKIARSRACDLEREKAPWALALARLVRAGIATGEGDRVQAIDLFRQSITLLEAVDMPIYAAAARWRLGELLGGAEGKALIAQGEAWIATQAVRQPARMAAVYAPMPVPRA